MCYLTTVVGSFHGRLLAARLGAEGVSVVLRGATDGPYPITSSVDVLVPARELDLAREILLGDSVDDIFRLRDIEDPGALDAGEDRAVGDGWNRSAAAAPTPWAASSAPLTGSCSRVASTEGWHRRSLHAVPATLVVLVSMMLVLAGCVAAVVR